MASPATSGGGPLVSWVEDGEVVRARWRSGGGAPPPRQVVVVDGSLSADRAHRLAAAGTAMLWRGDFPAARRLLTALGARVDRAGGGRAGATPAEAFHLDRRRRGRRARLLGLLLVPLGPGHVVPLRRAPDARQACQEVYGPADGPSVVSLRDLLGVISAHEWRRRGIAVPGLAARIHPHHGVFPPVRHEYVDLVAGTPLPSRLRAFDIGTGTGVLAAVLARRGVASVVATDRDERALRCARDNLDRLGLGDRVDLVRADLFPAGRAPLVVCNPPWLPARPASPLDHAVYDPGGRVLRAFLDRLGRHLTPGGEGWLVLSDLAEHLGLRTRADLLAAVHASGLRVLGRADTRPRHPRAADRDDPLHAARAAEVTSLWRLGAR